MDKAKQYRIDEWIEQNVYGFFEDCMNRSAYPNAVQAAAIAPFLQMYQAIQTRELQGEMDSLWRLLADGQAGIWISGDVDVDLKEKEQAKNEKRKNV